MIYDQTLITEHDRLICEQLQISQTQYYRFVSNCYIDEHGCMVWDGHCQTAGYGVFSWRIPGDRFWRGAHRMVMEFYLGRLLFKDEYVCHRCPQNNNACMLHTYLGDASTNTIDARNDGTHVSLGWIGDGHPNVVITDKQVKKIRKMYATNKYSQAELARLFNTHPASVHQIVTNKRRLIPNV